MGFDNVKQVCGNCGVDQKPLGGHLTEIRDWHGNPIGLLGTACSCHTEIRRLLNRLCNMHGGFVDEEGHVRAAPRGTPHIHGFEGLRKAVEDA